MNSLGTGYRAVVIGASGGIGSAVAAALEGDDGCGDLRRLSRSTDALDLTDEATVARAAARLAGEGGAIDLLFDATGALDIDGQGPEKSMRALDPAAMMRQFAVNAVGPALLIKHFAPLLARDRRAVFATLSARVGSIGDNRLGGWISYRSAKAALNQIVRTASVELSRTHPKALLVALHPGTVETGLTAAYPNARKVSPRQSAEALLGVLDTLPVSATGGFYAYDGQPIEW